MLVFQDKTSLQEHLRHQRSIGNSIGFVATMGALHQGHVALLQRADEENDVVVASIYVNPAQFNNPDDLARYPRDLVGDKIVLESNCCDVLFLPDDQLMYPDRPKVRLDLGTLERLMEGKYRPGHFNGVGIAVLKLFNLVNPDRAYFGQKDWQQFTIIKYLVKELFLAVEVRCVDTVREPNGLAISSRNLLLNGEQSEVASNLHKALVFAAESLRRGNRLDQVIRDTNEFVKDLDRIDLEYFNIVDAENLEPLERLQRGRPMALCIAGYINQVRLIDNILITL